MTRPTVLVFDNEAAAYVAALADACPGYAFVAATDEAAATAATDAEVLVALAPRITPAILAALPRLRWIHALTTGVDNLLALPALPEDVALSNTRGIHGPQMSELAILLMLSLARSFPKLLANQQAARWERWPQPLLEGRTVCLLGLGGIAEALAARCAAFGMTVTGVSDGRAEVPGFARVWRRAHLADAAAEADFLVVLVPYAPETRHIVDARILAAMRPSAFLVNIARGGCVDETALLDALGSGTIAGAGLDVFETEPLPPTSPFWSLPNVILTPHIGGMADVYHRQALPVAIANLRAFAEGGAAALPNRIARR